MPNFISADELFHRILSIIEAEVDTPVNKLLHETLVLTCSEGLAGSNLAFGNLFAQVDFLCKKHHVTFSDTIAIQNMRRASNRAENMPHEELMYACRALAVFVSAVFDTDIPSFLVRRIPVEDMPQREYRHIDYHNIRGLVSEVSDDTFTVNIDQNATEKQLTIHLKPHQEYLKNLLQIGSQVNLIDVDTAKEASIIVYEPDYLIDISSIARCFTDYGHHPLSYLINAMSPTANSQAILLGNFAGTALDDIINGNGHYIWRETFKKNFKDKALEYCTCDDLNRKEDFRTAALRQTQNIQQIVAELFGDFHGDLMQPQTNVTFNREKAILEPSFVCEQLGLQGRADLMTTDFKLLVEQKSGNNYNIQTHQPNEYGSFQKEEHYVQLLLYYGVLRQNFHVPSNKIDMRLLYSKYPLPGGLVVVNFYQKLFREAIGLRNRIVAHEYSFALNGFEGTTDMLSADIINEKKLATPFYFKYIQPRLDAVINPLHNLSPLEKAYYERMMTFVYREQLAAKVGEQEGVGNSTADLWNMPLANKKEAGNIYTDLTIAAKAKSKDINGFDIITLNVPNQGEDFLPNFRLGDLVYLYSYLPSEGPDVRNSLLFKGNLIEIHTDSVTVKTVNPIPKEGNVWAIEHSGSDIGGTSAIRSLHQFITSAPKCRQLLLAQRVPEQDTTLQLTRNYHPTYDPLLLKAFQAKDYFLLVGPPGTGKTSMALQFMVREALAKDESILLMSYTNRAVDEICGMLSENAIDYIRIGSEYCCDKRYKSHLLSEYIENNPRLNVIREQLMASRVIVGTTSTLQSKSYIFRLKSFSMAIIDEASQILEPNLVGLLSHLPKFILIGDYKQLPAVVQQEANVSAVHNTLLHEIGLTNCRNSLFERLIHVEEAAQRTHFMGVLRAQGRMHPAVAAFPNRMFYFKERLKPVPLPHQLEEQLDYNLPSENTLDDALKAHRMLFIPSAFCAHPQLSDKVNPSEAKIVARILARIQRFYGPSFDANQIVGVIVPYRNQIAMIRKEIEKLGITGLEKISIDTVERYQGSQRDVIIYSFTIQHRYQLDFLTANCFEEDGHIIDRKLNVAITRARKQMIMTGCRSILEQDAVFKELIATSAIFNHQSHGR